MLQSKLLMSDTQLSQADTHLRHMERIAYEIGFNECHALAVQILPLAEVSFL